MDIEEDFPAVNYDDVMAEINAHDAANLVTCERTPHNGYVTFKFYQGNSSVAKMTFDELYEDTAFRVKTVLNFLSDTHKLVDQADIERVWEQAEPEQQSTFKGL